MYCTSPVKGDTKFYAEIINLKFILALTYASVENASRWLAKL